MRPGRPRRLAGTIGFLLVLGAVVALLLLQRVDPERDTTVARLAEIGVDPVPHLAQAARGHQALLFGLPVADRAAWRVVIAATDSVARGSGLEAVGVPAPARHQPALDRYLASSPEEPSLLPPTEGERGAGLRDFYRAIWRLNDDLGADRAVRLLALLPADWPPSTTSSPAQAVRRWAERSAHARDVLVEALLRREPSARIVVVADGLDVLRGVRVRVSAGGGATSSPDGLGQLLEGRFGSGLYTVLADGPREVGGGAPVAGFGGTGFYGDARRVWSGSATLAPLADDEGLGQATLSALTWPGVEAELEPARPALGGIADAYVYPGGG